MSSAIPALDVYKRQLQGHPDMKGTPGVDMSSGSLGQGISAAVGMALAGKLDEKNYRVYALLGDGEIEEGQVWEAAMFAGHHALSNLCVIVDSNGLQIDGPVAEVGGPEPIDKKFEAFGFEVMTIDGNNFDDLEEAFAAARACKEKPFAIIAKTTKGKMCIRDRVKDVAFTAPVQVFYRQNMSLRQIGDMDVVAYAGAVAGIIIFTIDRDAFSFSQGNLKNDGDQMSFRLVHLPDFSAFVCEMCIRDRH